MERRLDQREWLEWYPKIYQAIKSPNGLTNHKLARKLDIPVTDIDAMVEVQPLFWVEVRPTLIDCVAVAFSWFSGRELRRPLTRRIKRWPNAFVQAHQNS